MKKVVIAVVLILLSLTANAAEMISHVRLLAPIDVPKSREVRAMFEGLKPEALQFGLGEAMLIGAIDYQPLTPPNTRVVIKWHSIGVNGIGGTGTQQLQAPLVSQFTVNTARIEANTSMSVRGDLEQVAQAYLLLKQAQERKTPRDLVNSREKTLVGDGYSSNSQQGAGANRNDPTQQGAGAGRNDPTQNSGGANDLAPSGSRSGAGLTNNPTNSDSYKMNTEMMVTAFEDCAARYDIAAGLSYPQTRKLTKTQAGQVMSTGSCADSGTPIEFIYTWEDCATRHDIAAGLSYPQARKLGKTREGLLLSTGSCEDHGATVAFIYTWEDCAARNDIAGGISYPQARPLGKTPDGTLMSTGACVDHGTPVPFVFTWDDCSPARIDMAGGFVYPQARKLYKTQAGLLMSTGACEDHGTTAAIITAYGTPCADVVDIAQMKAYQQYKQYATLSGQRLDITLCTADFAKFYPIVGITAACGYRHDFVNNRSIKQEELQYTDKDGKVVNVRACGDSTAAYAQYTTTATCTPTIDNPNRLVIYNTRVAFKDGNGAELYATACAPSATQQFAISEAFCSPKYEHDFVNHVSYYVTSSYYVDNLGASHAISSCTRSASNSFVHVFQTTGCTVTNDDNNLMTHWNKLTQIVTPVDGTLTIAPCAELGSPTPYAYIGETRTVVDTNVRTVVANWIIYGTAYALPSIRQLYPAANYTNSMNNISHTFPPAYTGTKPCFGEQILGWQTTVISGAAIQDQSAIYTYYWQLDCGTPALSYTRNYTRYDSNYLRGDGSTFVQQGTRNDISITTGN